MIHKKYPQKWQNYFRFKWTSLLQRRHLAPSYTVFFPRETPTTTLFSFFSFEAEKWFRLRLLKSTASRGYTHIHTHARAHARTHRFFFPKRCTLIHFRENHHRTICFDVMALGYLLLPLLPPSTRSSKSYQLNSYSRYERIRWRKVENRGGWRREIGHGRREEEWGRERRGERRSTSICPSEPGFSPASVSLLATLWLNYLQSTSNIFKLNFMYVESCIFPLFLLYRIALRSTNPPPPPPRPTYFSLISWGYCTSPVLPRPRRYCIIAPSSEEKNLSGDSNIIQKIIFTHFLRRIDPRRNRRSTFFSSQTLVGDELVSNRV